VTASTPVAHDIMPGKQGAVLTLADGRQVVIDSAGNANIAQQGNVVVSQQNGQLVYRKEKGGNNKVEEGSAPLAYNMLSTPKGRQFELMLPDGSKVWLNAASSIRYPVSFTSDERRVEITGEAYFEVEKNPAKPFRVAIFTSPGNQMAEVEVLGTHFNINAYSDEQAINTTLLEGKVKVTALATQPQATNNKLQTILKPGQQASISDKSSKILVQTVDADAFIAWKNGFFNFQDASLQQVMRQLARWYDVDVKYESGIPNIEFGGKMGRDLTLSNVLHFLEKSGLHCSLENNHTLIVKP
jgi:transmembrane sensor